MAGSRYLSSAGHAFHLSFLDAVPQMSTRTCPTRCPGRLAHTCAAGCAGTALTCFVPVRVLATSGAIDLTKLCVIPGKQCWVLYLDLLVCAYSPMLARHATCVRDHACVHVCVCVCLPLHQVLDTGGTLIDALTLAAYAALNNAR